MTAGGSAWHHPVRRESGRRAGLAAVELNGCSVAFEEGTLLWHGEEAMVDWHIVLVHVSARDVLASGAAEGECDVAALTAQGERLEGRGSLLQFASGADSLRLIGRSSLSRCA